MPSLTNVDAHRNVDEELGKHEDALRPHEDVTLALKTHKNTCSAMSTLPNELLSQIFLDSKKAFECRHSSDPVKSTWLNIAGVCRHWRAIAMNTPRLWSTIKLSQGDVALEMLRRSKCAPLKVVCESPAYDSKQFKTIAQASMLEIARIQTVDITAHVPKSLVEFLSLNSKSSAPALESLSLMLDRPVLLEPGVPKGVLWRNMPALRTLTLHLAVAPSELPFLPHLSQFKLVDFDLDFTPGVHLSWLLQLFRNTPNLEEIDIFGIISDPLVNSTSPKVPLRKLSQLSLLTKDIAASRIFTCLDYPASASVKFTCWSEPIVEHFVGLRAAGARFAMAEEAIRAVTIRASGAIVVKFKPSETQQSPLFELSLRNLSHAIPSYVELLSSFPVDRVPILTLTLFTRDRDARQVAELIPAFKNLKVLCLGCPHLAVLTGLLKPEGAEKPPCPELKTILVDYCDVECKPNKQDFDSCDALFQILRERIFHGVPIRRLILRRCGIQKHVLEKLKEYTDVDWDGQPGRTELLELRNNKSPFA